MKYFDIMREFCDSIKVDFTKEMYEKFISYMDILIEYNKKVNLTAILDRDEIIKRHFLDSISVFIYNINRDSYICDVGSGAGFPGIPMKIMRDDLKVDLIEATTKKAKFLEYVINQLGLKEINVLNSRVEDISHNNIYRGKYDYVLSRAMARLSKLLELSFPLVKNGGCYLALKGEKAHEELHEANRCIEILGGRFSKIINIEMFNSNIVVINKICDTPNIYPREYKLILKKSL